MISMTMAARYGYKKPNIESETRPCGRLVTSCVSMATRDIKSPEAVIPVGTHHVHPTLHELVNNGAGHASMHHDLFVHVFPSSP